MKRILILLISSIPYQCHASKAAQTIDIEIKTERARFEKAYEDSIIIKLKAQTECIGSSMSTYSSASKTAQIESLRIYPQYRNNGAGSSLLRLTLANLSKYSPEYIEWEAQWLDKVSDKKALAKLTAFYQRHGAIIVRRMNCFNKMEYPVMLAHALQVLHPIFSAHEKSPLLKHDKTQDPFFIIVEYLNAQRKHDVDPALIKA